MQTTGFAELGEALAIAERIHDGDFDSWITEWTRATDQVFDIAERYLARNQPVTAREAWMRASNYYRAAVFYASYHDPRHKHLWSRSRECFQKAISLMAPSVEILEIPFENVKLPGYFVSGGAGKRPTLLAIGGFDSTAEEIYHWIGVAAAKRDWNCLIFEGPGQWSALYLAGLKFRCDYEVPSRAVVDYALSRPDVDAEQLVLIGYSLGVTLHHALRLTIRVSKPVLPIRSYQTLRNYSRQTHPLWCGIRQLRSKTRLLNWSARGM